MPKIFLLRHGALPANPEHRFVGQRDLALTELGLAQAYFWQKELALENIQVIISSDLTRCKQTALIIQEKLEVPLYYEENFREISLGAWEGMNPAEIALAFPGQYQARGLDMYNFCPQNGESFADLAKRVLPSFEFWTKKYAEKNILIVAHLAVIRTIMAAYLALQNEDMFKLNLPYGSCAWVENS